MRGRTEIAGLMLCAVTMYSPQINAQSWETVDPASVRECLRASDRLYAAMPNMRLSTQIYSYEDASSTVPQDNGTSVVWRIGDRYKAEHLGVISYQDEELSLVVDPEEMTILVGAPRDLRMVMQRAMEDSLLAHAVRVGRSEGQDGTRFRIKLAPGGTFDIVELTFDRQGWLRKEVLYWANPMPRRPGDPSRDSYPKLVLVFGVPERIDPSSVNADPGHVVSWRNGELVPSAAWRNYTVFDTRPR